MRTSLRRSVATAAAVVLLAPLAACSSDPDADPDADPGAGDAGSSTSALPLPAPTSATAADGTTAPGSVLGLGDTALVPLDRSNGDGSAVVRVTVTAIEPSEAPVPSWADDGDVVHRIDATLTVESWDGEERLTVGPWLGGAVDGTAVGKADAGVDTEIGCDDPGLGPVEEPGTTVDVCVTAVAPADATVVAAWARSGTAYGFDRGAPLLWLP
ncbi:hypothetical protein [Nocardioides zeae]|uniref:DUF4352 domain-containing protein n=1 Tax=Nocardioides zeae TaxID=1457234 RepID=A0A6P0HI71_9ACTN|nr:hypothetical protein [Nocardioides zeae]NEN77980.1 hypothetical protein [Nocardioides zeae]